MRDLLDFGSLLTVLFANSGHGKTLTKSALNAEWKLRTTASYDEIAGRFRPRVSGAWHSSRITGIGAV
jgi:hypothetical protein